MVATAASVAAGAVRWKFCWQRQLLRMNHAPTPGCLDLGVRFGSAMRLRQRRPYASRFELTQKVGVEALRCRFLIAVRFPIRVGLTFGVRDVDGERAGEHEEAPFEEAQVVHPLNLRC